jgi:hypothetical protein
MKLEIIHEDKLMDLKSNLPSLVKNFEKADNTWLADYFGENPFIITKYEVNDFELDMSHEKPFLTDAENVSVYTAILDFFPIHRLLKKNYGWTVFRYVLELH